ncbi:uncharacterized protein [Branchiostoma lanceolatum]|uniref:uncharacterized protein n=1 Tax=Branchiostoma lanceolatum TaxID=7740 RepID=UPI0034539586
MDEKRLNQSCPAGTAYLGNEAASNDEAKDVMQGKKMKTSATTGVTLQADICSSISRPVSSIPKSKRHKRLPCSSCSRTMTYDYKMRTFIARNPTQRRRRVKRIKNRIQRAQSKSVVQKKSTARKTTNPGCSHDLMKTKAVQSSETVQTNEMIDVTKLYTKIQCTEDSMAQSDLNHKSKGTTGENLSPVTTSRGPLENRRTCQLGGPRIPHGYPHFHGNKKSGRKTARASLRTGIPARYIKYSSMQLPHRVQKVQLKCCTGNQSPDGEKKGNIKRNDGTFGPNGENTVERPGEDLDVSNNGQEVCLMCPSPHVSTMFKKRSVRRGQTLETVVSRLWTRVCQGEELQSQVNTVKNISGPKVQKLQFDSLSGVMDYGNMREEAENSRQQDLTFQTNMDNSRRPADTEVDCLYRGTSWTGQVEGSLQSGICEEGLSLRLSGTLETMEPTYSEIMEEIQTDVEEPPMLDWMGDSHHTTCHSEAASPPRLDRIPLNLSCHPDLTTCNGSTFVAPTLIMKAEQTCSSLLDQKLGNNLPDTSTSPQGYMCSTGEVARPQHYQCTTEEVQNSELLTFPQDPYPDVDVVNRQYFMSFSNQESLDAHKKVEARVEKEFKVDSQIFIQNVMDFKLHTGKQKRKKKHAKPEGWNPGFHNRHTRYNMMLVEEVLKRRFAQAAGQINPRHLPSHQVPYTTCSSHRRRGRDEFVSRLLGGENLHWKRRARLMWDMVQTGTVHNMSSSGVVEVSRYHGNTEAQYNTAGRHQLGFSNDRQAAKKPSRMAKYFDNEDTTTQTTTVVNHVFPKMLCDISDTVPGLHFQEENKVYCDGNLNVNSCHGDESVIDRCHMSRHSQQSLVWSSQCLKEPSEFKGSSLEMHHRENQQNREYGWRHHHQDQTLHMSNKDGLPCGPSDVNYAADTSSRFIGHVQNKGEPSRSQHSTQGRNVFGDKAATGVLGTTSTDVSMSPVNCHSRCPTQMMSYPHANCSDSVRGMANLHIITSPDLFTAADVGPLNLSRQVLETKTSAPVESERCKQTEINFATFESQRAQKQRPVKSKTHATANIEKRRVDEHTEHKTCSNVMKTSTQTVGNKCTSKENPHCNNSQRWMKTTVFHNEAENNRQTTQFDDECVAQGEALNGTTTVTTRGEAREAACMDLCQRKE